MGRNITNTNSENLSIFVLRRPQVNEFHYNSHKLICIGNRFRFNIKIGIE